MNEDWRDKPDKPKDWYRWMVQREDGKFLTWDGWGRSFWVPDSGGLYPDKESAERDAKIEGGKAVPATV